ncbi:BatA domain-containing protein [Myxococcus sp. MISCRS1]|uniref:BatA domain-containing protein n=1 Tax=unclassified Myxococcus TaxID=2648731 RepID=UPI001CBC9BB5|nr:BatA domain-containing protein [Myxococcus sp. MISCRS1]MBZ4413118.1 BatA domain-containing protein [Myxococcus sp. XM-1-1-1]MCY1000692.1 BatA domain-containing protein [Myxococcus sp. MISCRS1]
MTFGNPWMLLGALGALIPLLVHLFDRRRPRPHPFGPLAFVLRSQKRTASRLKLKRLLLYVLRTLILLAIPIALARPELTRDAQAAQVVKGPAATAIILDASLSMRWSDGTSLFERGRDEARDALRDLLPEEPATVVVCTGSPAAPPPPGFDRARLRALVDEAKPTYGGADLSRCMDLAARSLEENPMPAKRLVVVSDMAATAFRLEAPPPTVKGPTGAPVKPEVVLRDVAEGKETLANHAIVDLKVEPALQAGPRAFQFTFTVRNFGTEAVKDLEAAVRTGETTLAKGFVDVPAGGTTQKALTVRFPQGGTVVGQVTLAPDALAEDDRRAFVLPVPRALKALVVNGAPHATRYRDEAFFVDAALTAPGSPVEVAVRDAEVGLREDFSTYDLVLLLNVAAPNAEEAARLSTFVENGGGLFVSMGDRVNTEDYNQKLGAVLPRPLRVLRTSAERDTDPEAETKAARLAQVNQEHVLFSPFTGRAEEGLVGARFYRYMLLEADNPTSPGASQVLATYEDGAPAVAVMRKGKGRVALFTSTVDRDWSDFAIRTSFLPLMQRFAAYLTGSLEEREEVRVRVGELASLRPEGSQKVTAVKAPDGSELPLKEQTEGSVVAGPVLEPGAYSVLGAEGKMVPALSFAATLDPAESDLTRVPQETLTAYFGEETVKASSGDEDRPSVPLWTWLILAACVAFFFEGTLLRK